MRNLTTNPFTSVADVRASMGIGKVKYNEYYLHDGFERTYNGYTFPVTCHVTLGKQENVYVGDKEKILLDGCYESFTTRLVDDANFNFIWTICHSHLPIGVEPTPEPTPAPHDPEGTGASWPYEFNDDEEQFWYNDYMFIVPDVVPTPDPSPDPSPTPSPNPLPHPEPFPNTGGDEPFIGVAEPFHAMFGSRKYSRHISRYRFGRGGIRL